MSALSLPPARNDPTAREAIARAERTQRENTPLTVPLAAYVGLRFDAAWLRSRLGRALVAQASRVIPRRD